MNQDSKMLEVYTEDNKTKIGIADREVVHYCNLWHREIACWVVNEKNEILLQRRSSNKKQSPNMLSVTAGHVDLNELPFEATLREIKEEIGLDIQQQELMSLDTFKAKKPNNYHFKYVYLLRTDKKIEELTMQENEVSELLYVSIDKLKEMLKEPNTELTFAHQYYTPIILERIEKYINK